jgi:hypothetical protein
MSPVWRSLEFFFVSHVLLPFLWARREQRTSSAYLQRVTQPQGLSNGSDVAPNPPLGLVDAAVGVWVVEADVHPP